MRTTFWIACALLLWGCPPRHSPTLALGAERVELSFEGREPSAVRVRSSEEWSAESDAVWCRVEAVGDSLLKVYADENSGAARQTTVWVRTASLQASLLVRQGSAPGGDFLRYRDSLALVSIFRAGNGPEWTWTIGFKRDSLDCWSPQRPITRWHGVGTERIDGSLRVTSLDLRQVNNYAGALPDSLALMNKLSGVYLASLPLERSPLGLLARLEAVEALDINFAPYPLAWPSDLGGFRSLVLLYAAGVEHPNRRLGAGWSSLTRLRSVDLSNGTLQGGFPTVLFGCSGLEWLDLSNNPIGGAIPAEVGGWKALEHFDVSGCNLTGALPAQIGALEQLMTLKAANNALQGTVPAALGSVANLQILNLSGCGFTALAPEVWNCRNLRYVDVSFNNLTGTIPAAAASMQHLEAFALVGNRMSGAIPDEVVNCERWSSWRPSSLICPQQSGYGFTNCR